MSNDIKAGDCKYINREGYNRLWAWFSLSYASWLTIPRVLMHEMPDDWQMKMAELLEQWDEAWDSSDMPNPYVSAKKNGKFIKWPSWLLNYRHPNYSEIETLRAHRQDLIPNEQKEGV